MDGNSINNRDENGSDNVNVPNNQLLLPSTSTSENLEKELEQYIRTSQFENVPVKRDEQREPNEEIDERSTTTAGRKRAKKDESLCPVCYSPYRSFRRNPRCSVQNGYMYAQGLFPHWLKLQHKYANRICTGCNRKPVINDQRLLYAHHVITRSATNSVAAKQRLQQWFKTGYFQQARS